MQAILLAAGKGVRMRPATLKTPKPLLLVHNKTILEHVLDALPPEIDEIILVVNYLHGQIRTHIGDRHNSIPISYLIQDPLTGTAGALFLAQHMLRERFLVLNADNIYDPKSLEELLQYDQSLLVIKTQHSLAASVKSTNGHFAGLEPCVHPPCLLVCGAYVLNQSFFQLSPVEIYVGSHTEFGLPQTLVQSSQPIQLVTTTRWFPIGIPEELTHASLCLQKHTVHKTT